MPTKPPKKQSDTQPDTSYQELNQELQAVLEQLETGELDIDKTVGLYRRGLEIVAGLEKGLRESEHIVSELRAGN